MRAVNLLPQDQRRARATGARAGSSYFVIGGLALVLVGVLVYVFTANQASSDQQAAQKVEREANAATARADQLAAFGNFAQVKLTRELSVSQLAANRFDWERTLRELARVLPKGVYVTNLDATPRRAPRGCGRDRRRRRGCDGPIDDAHGMRPLPS